MRLCVFLGMLFYFTGSAFAKSEPTPNCVELLQDRCQTCHYLNRVCQKLGKKSKRRWKATLTRMVKRRGAKLSSEEQKFLLDCLTISAPDLKKECGN